jgi:hypothetical protein
MTEQQRKLDVMVSLLALAAHDISSILREDQGKGLMLDPHIAFAVGIVLGSEKQRLEGKDEGISGDTSDP